MLLSADFSFKHPHVTSPAVGEPAFECSRTVTELFQQRKNEQKMKRSRKEVISSEKLQFGAANSVIICSPDDEGAGASVKDVVVLHTHSLQSLVQTILPSSPPFAAANIPS
jgi:hypothetical protein